VTDDVEVPAALMPRDDVTRRMLDQGLAAWWDQLTPDQRMAVHQLATAGAAYTADGRLWRGGRLEP